MLWGCSLSLILIAFILFDRTHYLMLVASLIGATSLIFNAKANPLGQFLMVIFSILYGIISYSCTYYGEMITYLGMTAPMALFSLIAWKNNPFEESTAEVKVNQLHKREVVVMFVLSLLVTSLFYFILRYFHTANLFFSTLSVTTSFIAVYLTYRRSVYFALAYAANDVVLIILWLLATLQDISYLSVLICFLLFFINDLYGYINWQNIQKRQWKQSSLRIS